FTLTSQPGSGDVRATLELSRNPRGVRPAAA
ncbi:MAG: hypothetical protein JWQ62_1009, partial [Lacunisphaera sp.]|nr:hypothetical protein [Lacunisphaera sp.]